MTLVLKKTKSTTSGHLIMRVITIKAFKNLRKSVFLGYLISRKGERSKGQSRVEFSFSFSFFFGYCFAILAVWGIFKIES